MREHHVAALEVDVLLRRGRREADGLLTADGAVGQGGHRCAALLGLQRRPAQRALQLGRRRDAGTRDDDRGRDVVRESRRRQVGDRFRLGREIPPSRHDEVERAVRADDGPGAGGGDGTRVGRRRRRRGARAERGLGRRDVLGVGSRAARTQRDEAGGRDERCDAACGPTERAAERTRGHVEGALLHHGRNPSDASGLSVCGARRGQRPVMTTTASPGDATAGRRSRGRASSSPHR